MIGYSLAHYEITSELGRGGMGIVYRATDTKLNREVALKILPAAALASEEDRARFFREAQSAAQLHHPNIATVFEIDETIPVDADGNEVAASDGPRPYIVMEFIEGETLQELIKKGPMKLADAVNVAAQVTEALKAAHAKEIVHRDIKSANIMLTDEGIAKVLDFGLAKTNQSTMLTRMGSTMGTVAFMSPEQARGQEVDGRSDLYSLGTMMYEMVAGQLPFAGEYEQAVVYGILNESPDPLTSRRTGVPMQLEWIVNKLMAKDPDYRYQSAAGLLADLKALDLSGSGHSRRSMDALSASTIMPSSQQQAIPKWIWVAAIAGVVIAVAAGWFAKPEPMSEEQILRFPITLDMVSPNLDARWSADETAIYYVATDTADGSAHVRRYNLASGRSERVEGTKDVESFVLTSDGKWIVFGASQNLNRMLLSGGQPVVIAKTDNNQVYSPLADGSFAHFQGSTLFRYDDSGAAEEFDNPLRVGLGGFPGFIVAVPGTDMLYWTEATSLDSIKTYVSQGLAGDLQHFVDGRFAGSATGSGELIMIPFGEGPMEVARIDTDSGRLISPLLPFEAINGFADLSSSGHILFQSAGPNMATTFAPSASSLFILDDGNQETIRTIEGAPFEMAVSPNGKFVIMDINLGPAATSDHHLFRLDLESKDLVRLSREGSFANAFISSNGEWVYFDRGQISTNKADIARRRTDGSGGIELVLEDSVEVINPALSPDGNQMVYSRMNSESSDWDVFIHDFETQVSSPIDDSDYLQNDATFSPDGKYLVYHSNTADGSTIVVAELDGPGKTEVSSDGLEPIWSPDGKFVYFLIRHSFNSHSLARRPVTLDPVFRPLGGEEILYRTDSGTMQFDVLPDGRVVVLESPPNASSGSTDNQVWVILNFDEYIRNVTGANE